MRRLARPDGFLLLLLFGFVTACYAADLPAPPPTPIPPETVWLGVTPDAAPVGELIREFFSADGVDVLILTAPAADLAGDLAGGRLDGVIGHDFPPEPGWHNPVAVDGLVLIAPQERRVESLTQSDARRLLIGRLTWADVGAGPQSVTLFLREPGSSSRRTLADLLLAGQPVPVTTETLPTDQAVIAAVSADPNGLGVIWYGQRDSATRPLPIDGIEPVPAALADQSYPLTVPIVFSSRTEPQGGLRLLVAWLQGEEGQALIEGRYGRVDR